jgi:cation transport ATPase
MSSNDYLPMEEGSRRDRYRKVMKRTALVSLILTAICVLSVGYRLIMSGIEPAASLAAAIAWIPFFLFTLVLWLKQTVFGGSEKAQMLISSAIGAASFLSFLLGV